MSEIGLRILRLQKEFLGREEMIGLKQQYGKDSWTVRSEEEIAADYEAALRELLQAP